MNQIFPMIMTVLLLLFMIVWCLCDGTRDVNQNSSILVNFILKQYIDKSFLKITYLLWRKNSPKKERCIPNEKEIQHAMKHEFHSLSKTLSDKIIKFPRGEDIMQKINKNIDDKDIDVFLIPDTIILNLKENYYQKMLSIASQTMYKNNTFKDFNEINAKEYITDLHS